MIEIDTSLGVGKTSLVNTFKRYVENPGEKPSSVLTQKSDKLIETQVLEFYDNLSMKQEQLLGVDLEGSQPSLVHFKENDRDNEKNLGLQLKIVDLGTKIEKNQFKLSVQVAIRNTLLPASGGFDMYF